MRRRIRFLRHFHRMWPRFFQTREERFIKDGATIGLRLLGLPKASPRAPLLFARPDVIIRPALATPC
jgi:hypothetical protein